MSEGVVHIVVIDGGERDFVLDVALRATSDRWETRTLELVLDQIPAQLPADRRRLFDLFADTPESLIDAWLVAEAVDLHVPDGEVVAVTDARGIGGVLALAEAVRPVSLRRPVWTLAGSGSMLRCIDTFGTASHIELPEASSIDWELVQYRHSEVVLAPGAAVADILSGLGIHANLVATPEPEPVPRSAPAAHRSVWIPGPVSRTTDIGSVLRAIAPIPDLEVTVSDVDEADVVWSGTTWDTLAAPRRLLGERLSRSSHPPATVDLVVIGDRLTPPDATTRKLWASGVAVAAPAGSVTSASWPQALTWSTEDDLEGLVTDGVGAAGHDRSAGGDRWEGPGDRPTSDPERARRVSVGVPAFGPSPYLEECIASILDQTQPPVEVLVMDDGSENTELDEVIERLCAEAPDVVRKLRQPNRGVCVARNRLMAEMRGDAFVLVDQDDRLHPEFIARTAEALRNQPKIAAVATWTEFFGEYEAIEAKPPFDARVGRRENPIVSTAALVDMRIRDLGLAFAPDLAFIYCEDWHFWSQIVAASERMGLVPEPLVGHRVHRASGGFQRTEHALAVGRARASDVLSRLDEGGAIPR